MKSGTLNTGLLHELAAESVPGSAIRSGLYTGEIDTANSASRDGAGQSQVRHHPIEAAENRSGDYSKHPPREIDVFKRLSVSEPVFQSSVQAEMLTD